MITNSSAMSAARFGDDVAFLKAHTDAIVLRQGEAAIVVVPDYQGRVMTATATGDAGASTGWINYDLVAEGILPLAQREGLQKHLYAFGGEERFWLGPEGGQYSIFFAPGAEFSFAEWRTPAPIDTDPWRVVARSDAELEVQAEFSLRNWFGTQYELGVHRAIRLLDRDAVNRVLDTSLPESITLVAYETENRVTNQGTAAWQPESGLLSIWLLGMYQPSADTVVFIPFREGSDDELGPVVNDAYFGPVAPERLKIEDGLILFRADGASRGKIGLPPGRSLGLAGSYAPSAGRITLIQYDAPTQIDHGYVNSLWELQDKPFDGDAINSYNDGPVEAGGEQMGPFYELESSSPALALAPGAVGVHIQRTIHLYGSEAELELVFNALTSGKSLETVKKGAIKSAG